MLQNVPARAAARYRHTWVTTYFLQSTAQGFNVPVEQYADTAFGATGFPSFGYGCAVFMQSDIVDFQRQGWKPESRRSLHFDFWICSATAKNTAGLKRQVIADDDLRVLVVKGAKRDPQVIDVDR